MTLTYSIYPKQDYTYPPVVQQRNRWFSLKPPFRSRIFHGFSTYFPLPRFLVPEGILYWLVVYLPLWKMMEFVSWDDEIPNWMEKQCSKPPTSYRYTSCCWHWWPSTKPLPQSQVPYELSRGRLAHHEQLRGNEHSTCGPCGPWWFTDSPMVIWKCRENHGKTTKKLMDELDGSLKISENVGETPPKKTMNKTRLFAFDDNINPLFSDTPLWEKMPMKNCHVQQELLTWRWFLTEFPFAWDIWIENRWIINKQVLTIPHFWLLRTLWLFDIGKTAHIYIIYLSTKWTFFVLFFYGKLLTYWMV